MKVYTGSQLLTMYRQMQSTMAYFNAKMLGTDNSVLREIVEIYREYTSILEGDQEVWNIYWTYKRRMWLPLDTVMHIVPDHTAELNERRRRRREAQVTATQRLRENLFRTRLKAEVIAADVLKWAPDGPADALLIDAPCSATGIFRRHPDVLHRVHPAIIEEMADLQTRLLARAADWVKPGGRLVFATCSLEPAEGEAQLERFLADRPDYAIDAPDAALLPPGVPVQSGGYVRTLPGMLAAEGGCDGFFIARLRRES